VLCGGITWVLWVETVGNLSAHPLLYHFPFSHFSSPAGCECVCVRDTFLYCSASCQFPCVCLSAFPPVLFPQPGCLILFSTMKKRKVVCLSSVYIRLHIKQNTLDFYSLLKMRTGNKFPSLRSVKSENHNKQYFVIIF